jgi:hypothetical protein
MLAIAKIIREKKELRIIDCEVRFHSPIVGRKQTVRLDTNTVIDEEQMLFAERPREPLRRTSGMGQALQRRCASGRYASGDRAAPPSISEAPEATHERSAMARSNAAAPSS